MKIIRATRKNSPSSPAAPLAQILREKVLPWAGECDDGYYAACDPTRGMWPHWQRAESKTASKNLRPESFSSCAPRGRRVTVKTRKSVQHAAVNSQITARWSREALQASRAPHIVCIVEGDAEIRIGDWLFQGRAGDFLFIPPDVPLDDGTRPHFVNGPIPTRQCAILWISAARTGLGCWICHSQGERHYTEPQQSCYVLHPSCIELFRMLTHEVGAGGAPHKTPPLQSAAISRHLFLSLLYILSREIEAGRVLQFAHQKIDERHAQDRLDPIGRAQEYIRSHLHEPLSINQLARYCYLSRSQFTRRFREETGYSFAAFVIETRLAEAQRLLRETDWGVERIGSIVGMHASRLRALFQERGLASPRSFRQSPAVTSTLSTPRVRNQIARRGKHARNT